MKRHMPIFSAALVAAFVLPAFGSTPTGYAPDVKAKLYAACYDPEVIGLQTAWPEYRVFGYRWQEAHVGWQMYVQQISKVKTLTLATAGTLQPKYATKIFGAWLESVGKNLTRNPWKNATLLGDYWKSNVDRTAYRAGLVAQYGAGWDMGDPEVIAAVNKRADDAMKIAFGSGSGVLWDENGILVPNAYGYSTNQPSLPSWWVKPASCTAVAPTPTPVPPGPTSTPIPSTGLKCRDPQTGQCYPAIFGGCPSGWAVCGEVIPTPIPAPTVNPTPTPETTPETSSVVACLSRDGRYAYAETNCKPDEIPLVRKP